MKKQLSIILTFLMLVALLPLAKPADAVAPSVSMLMGTTVVFSVPDGAMRIALGDNSIAELKIPDGQNHEILITAKKQGFTNFIVWPVHGSPRQYYLEVLPPGRQETIMVRIKVLEVSRGALNKLGVNLGETLQINEAPPSSPFRIGLPIRETYLQATINMLAQEKKAKVLAEPTLLCENNATASFLSGGEIPIPLITQSNVNIEWKRYGVQLEFKPIVQEADTIIMHLRPEVSSIDSQNSIELTNIKVPAIATRFADTTVTLKSGQSIVIAGLAREEKSRTATKIPLLGEIPVIGEFFRTNNDQDNYSELVFTVTPTLMTNNTVTPEQDYGTRMKNE